MMFPHVTVFQAGKSGKHSEVFLHANRIQTVIYGFLRGMGLGSFVLVVIILGMVLGPAAKAEMRYFFWGIVHGKEFNTSQLVIADEAEKTVAIQEEAGNYGVDSHFSIVIPKINAKSVIVPNVSAVNKDEYDQALQKGIAHAAGTYFPGQGKNIFLFSHSTDFDFNVSRLNAVFYLLKKLEKDDQIIVYFSDEKYVYKVDEILRVRPEDVSWLTNKTEEEVLYLQTCDPPGTSWHRLIVKAKPA